MDAPIFAALADPMRRTLLVNLAENSPKTATQLAHEYPISRPGIIKHLNILKAVGLVTVSQSGREKRYSLTPAAFNDLEQWLRDINAKWEARLLRLKTLIEDDTQ